MPFRAAMYASHMEIIILGARRWHCQCPEHCWVGDRTGAAAPASPSNGDKGGLRRANPKGEKPISGHPQEPRLWHPATGLGGAGCSLHRLFL